MLFVKLLERSILLLVFTLIQDSVSIEWGRLQVSNQHSPMILALFCSQSTLKLEGLFESLRDSI